MSKTDVLICGGGIIGSAVAYFLTELGYAGSVTVVERDPSYATASTALAASGIRTQFSHPLNIALSQFGVHMLREAPERFNLNPGFHENGYLYLAANAAQADVLRLNHDVQRRAGADVALLRPDEVKARFADLNTDDLLLASLGLSGEGWFDNMGLLGAMKRIARQRGVTYLHDEVTGIQTGESVRGVTLAQAGQMGCGWFINAAGPRAGKVAALAGVDLPVVARKRTNFLFSCQSPPPNTLPLIIDASGTWVRPEGVHFLTGGHGEADPDADFGDFEPDHALFEDSIWPELAHRIPAFEAIRATRWWAGHYEWNTLDQNAIIGPHPALGNMLFANGFSGHGLQQAPAAGRALAEWIIHGDYASIDCRAFGYGRVAANEPLFERCII